MFSCIIFLLLASIISEELEYKVGNSTREGLLEYKVRGKVEEYKVKEGEEYKVLEEYEVGNLTGDIMLVSG